MQEWIPEFDRAGLRIVALTTDSPEQNLRIAERLNLSIAILSDPDGRNLKKINMWDARWKIASYGYYLLDGELNVLSHYKGGWNASEEAKLFFLKKARENGQNPS